MSKRTFYVSYISDGKILSYNNFILLIYNILQGI